MVYNPLGRKWNGYVRVPLNAPTITVVDPYGYPVPVEVCIIQCTSNVLCIAQIFTATNATKTVRGPKGSAPYEAVIKIDDLPPLGYSIYTANPSCKYIHVDQQ